MDVTVKSGALATALAAAARVAAKKEVIPVLQYALVESDGADGILVTATDLDVGLLMECPGTVTAEGRLLLPVHRVHDLVRLIPHDEDVRITAGKKGDATIVAGGYHGRVMTLDAGDFPVLPAAPTAGVVTLSSPELRRMIEHVESAMAPHDTRYFTDGAHLSLAEGVATMVTSDGHRLAIATGTAAAGQAMTALIPKKTVAELKAGLLVDAEEVDFTTSENHLFFASGARRLVSRKIDGKFPDYSRIIPKEMSKRAVVAREVLSAAAKRVVVLMAKTMRTLNVTLALEPGWLTVSAVGAEAGEATERIVAEYDGDPVQSTYQVNYVLDFLAAARSAQVAWEVNTSASAGLFSQMGAEADGTYRVVIMPVRVPEGK